jgi:hypothetical protein
MPLSGKNGTWTISCLVINKSIIQTLPGVYEDMEGNKVKTATAPPSGL